MLDITLMNTPAAIRAAFIEKFTLTEAAFRAERKEWVADLEKDDPLFYDKLYLWDKMPDFPAVSFEQALAFLKSLEGEVLFMSESPEKPYCSGITVDGKEHKGAVARMDAAALAERIEYEWYEGWRAAAQDCYLENTVLPPDLYVFDEKMEHLLVFTHENDFWELEWEQPMMAAASRFCMMSGFPLPKGTTYQKIRALLTSEIEDGALMELEMYYSYSRAFRPFTVFRRDDTYWLNFDPDTKYPNMEALEQAKVFNGQSLAEIAALDTVRWEIKTINGMTYVE